MESRFKIEKLKVEDKSGKIAKAGLKELEPNNQEYIE